MSEFPVRIGWSENDSRWKICREWNEGDLINIKVVKMVLLSEHTSALEALQKENEELRGALGLKNDEYVQQVGTWKIIQRLEEQVSALQKENKMFRAVLNAVDERAPHDDRCSFGPGPASTRPWVCDCYLAMVEEALAQKPEGAGEV